MLLFKILKIIKLTIDNIEIKYYNIGKDKGVVKMLRTAKDCLRIREEKLKIFNKTQEEIKGQMKLIESKVMNANIGHRTKYIDIGNVGKLFSENEKQIIKDGYYITQDDKNGTRLYFDKEDYDDYVNSNKKIDFKKDTDEQVRDNRKSEALKFNTIGEWLDYLDKESYKTF